MGNKNSGSKALVILIPVMAVIIFLIVFLGITLTKNIGKSTAVVSKEDALKKLESIEKNIFIREATPIKSAVEIGTTTLAQELPEITKYPLSVSPTTNAFVEIVASTEKAGSGPDGWFNEVANDFNREGFEVNGEKVSVAIRPIASGLATDYIIAQKYVPDAFTPSNEYWGEMIKSEGISLELFEKKLVGNVPGVLLSKAKHKELTESYGAINMKTITQATVANEIAMGYTNPYASSTGLNFLISTLYTYDYQDILSDKAISGFLEFQENVPFVAYTTMQMREAAETGSLDGFILEYQTFANEEELKRDYTFTPFGARHDNPVYTTDSISDQEKEILKLFMDYCKDNKSQKKASEYGFNEYDDYVSELPEIEGGQLLAAQKLWKENKDNNRPIIAVFVADVSGSMTGEPINSLKSSLINGMQYINKENYIGLVSYSSDVVVHVPVEKFDLNQQAYFKGAVESLDAMGGTATYDGVAVGLDMLMDAMEKYPDAKPMLFVLSDGEANSGHTLKEVRPVLESLQVPVYTIGYNADLDALKQISSINEAASINADSEDVVYKLKSLFNSNL